MPWKMHKTLRENRSYRRDRAGIVMCGTWLLCVSSLMFTSGQLVVNVRSGNDVHRLNIQANTSEDVVRLDFSKADGTYIKQLIDFKNEIQIFKVIVLGEEELDQDQYQVMCFVTKFIRNEFISSDAMSKLRQKNPGAIRNPEAVKPLEVSTVNLLVDVDGAESMSPHIKVECQGTKGAVYTTHDDLKFVSNSLAREYQEIAKSTKLFAITNTTSCSESKDIDEPCVCMYELCIGWYPCGLKYCRGKDSVGKQVSYRCGIKTCRKCRRFRYYVSTKLMCLWDDKELNNLVF